MSYNLKTEKGRKDAFDAMTHMEHFDKKIVILGYGSIGTALLPLLFKIIKIKESNIYVVDKNKDRFKNLQFSGVNTINIKINKDNMKNILIDTIGLGQDDIIIDCSYEISTCAIYQLCAQHGISYTNSAVEIWEGQDICANPISGTYYGIYKTVEDANANVQTKKNNFIIGLGCNPGNVNIWTMYAMDKINNMRGNMKVTGHKSYAELAYRMGLRLVQISELDNQITKNPRKPGEYLNTWSSDAIPWYGEAFSDVEIGWGTHEKKLPEKVNMKLSNEYQMVLDRVGAFTWGLTYTAKNKNVVGMLIPHEECYSICKSLTLRDANNTIIYKPSCFYVYRPCDSSLASLIEISEKVNISNYLDEVQSKRRLMTDDIIEGRDELGCTLFFENGEVWWIGSLMDVSEARNIFNNNYNNFINATLMQVLAGYIGSIIFLIRSIKSKQYNGLLNPQDLPIEEFMKYTRPLLGPFGLIKVKDWSPGKNKQWQYDDFII
jgi:homospermidine synthase